MAETNKSSYAGLTINIKKSHSHCITVSKYASQRLFNANESNSFELKAEGEPIDHFADFVYLSATISDEGKIDRDLNVRI
jgi:ribosomal protein S18